MIHLRMRLFNQQKKKLELEIEKKVKKEVLILNKETGVENENIASVTSGEQIMSENTLKPTYNKNEKTSKLLTEENEEESPLKKEEAGIA